ncbi:MAG: DUF4965 domain-containing protein [Acidobacteriota bacterium]|nr:DUF4965 domain-containing protein [Acidobacteriota bacterium]
MIRLKVSVSVFVFAAVLSAQQTAFRPPATPLIACDPYFSVWSMSDHLNDAPTRHWTGTVQALTSLIRIDGQTYRLMGTEPRNGATIPQVSETVLPTRTIYEFEGRGVHAQLTFLTPLLPGDLDILSRPITYIAWQVKSIDGHPHAVGIYFDAPGTLAVNTPEQDVTASRAKLGNATGDMTVLRIGSREQPVLKKFGDNLRIDWGYLYLAASPDQGGSGAISSSRAAVASFQKSGAIPVSDDLRTPREAGDQRPALVWDFDMGEVGAAPVSRHLMLAYDELFSIEYFYRRLRPYWRRNGADTEDLIRDGLRDYEKLSERARQFDEKLMADSRRAGGPAYATLTALAYRQGIAAQKLVADLDGTPLMFPKENFSNGCIATVDVIYPAAPQLLYFNPQLLKATLTPVLEYASMPRWRFPFAPHDLGTYPLANGQVYGGGEKTEENQMPVEESANMILLMGALERAEGKADYAAKYWPVLAKWANYLKEKGLDPENQLCTDDFAGHLAHNANLSLKAIVALGAFAQLADSTGHKAEAAQYRNTAKGYAAQWIKMADDGDHYRLTFDKPGTWSQKYNLVWDRLLGLNLFPASVARKEIAYYKTRQNEFGLPLDSRKSYTKLDWLVWSASMADSKSDFEVFMQPVYRFMNDSPSRVPLTDWYDTITAKQEGFQARSVVGGVFIKLLPR